jgi:carnitine O-palmitoyltransferase 1
MPLPTNVAGAADPCDARARLAPYRKLEWQLSRRAEEVIAEAERSVQALAADLDLHVVGHGLYGKRFMKACKVSPDAYIQMAMQLAYFRDAGRFAATYESSMTRLFFHGRTETIRPLSKESCEFVRLMEDKTATPAAKLAALQAAEHVHKIKTADAMSGKGIDRHLFALYIVSVGKGIDAPFLQTALGEPWRLSTSQQPQQQTKLWDLRRDDDARRISPGGGFGPVADDGYGVSYMVAGEDAIFFHVSSKKSNPATDSARFIHHLFRAMREMRDILKSALKEEERDKALKRGASLGPLPLLPPCPAGVHGVPLDQSEDK